MASARLEPRIDYQMDVDVLKVGMDFPERIQGHNISQSGMFLAAPGAYRIGDRVSLRFNTASEEEVYVRSAEVVWVRGTNDAQFSSEPPGVGVRFLALESSGRTRIANYINRHHATTEFSGPCVSLKPNPALQKAASIKEKVSSARQWLAFEEENSQQMAEAEQETIDDWSFSVQPDSGIYPSHVDVVDTASPNSLVREALTTFKNESAIDIAPHQSVDEQKTSEELHLGEQESDGASCASSTAAANLESPDQTPRAPEWVDLSFDDDRPEQNQSSVPMDVVFHEGEDDNDEDFSQESHSLSGGHVAHDALLHSPDTSISEMDEWFERDTHIEHEQSNPKKRPMATFAGVAITVLVAAGGYRTMMQTDSSQVASVSTATSSSVEKPSSGLGDDHITAKKHESNKMATPAATRTATTPTKKTEPEKIATPMNPKSSTKPLFPQTAAVKSELSKSKEETSQIGSKESSQPNILVEHGRVTVPLLNGKVINKFALSSPSRVVVDLAGARFPGHQKNMIKTKGISELRIGQPNSDQVRVVVELSRDAMATRITTVKRKGSLAIAWK